MGDPSDVQAHITTFWSSVAAGYEAHAGNVAEYGSAEYQKWVDALASVLPDAPGDVLDVATGTGYLALAAASLGHRVTAVDLASTMIDELVASATARGLTVNASIHPSRSSACSPRPASSTRPPSPGPTSTSEVGCPISSPRPLRAVEPTTIRRSASAMRPPSC